MGFPVPWFVETIDDNLLCSVCSGVLQEAVLTPCGHSFCLICLQTWMQQQQQQQQSNQSSSGYRTSHGLVVHWSGSEPIFEASPSGSTDFFSSRSAEFGAAEISVDAENADSDPAISSTCPECRTEILPSQIHPIRSLRSLILSMTVQCSFADEGCHNTMSLERLSDHTKSCDFALVECAGCGVKVSRENLADHQLCCEVILGLYSDQRSSVQQTTSTEEELSPYAQAQKINHLSSQIKSLKGDLAEIRRLNDRLSNDLQQAQRELDQKQRHLQQIQNIYFDPDYEYGYVNSSICKLSGLISRFLTDKPDYIDPLRIFQCVKRCYDNFSRCGTAYEDDVEMLLATANASNWLCEQQKQQVRVWQMSLARYKQCTIWISRKKNNTNTQGLI